jgi:hypothetical protein
VKEKWGECRMEMTEARLRHSLAVGAKMRSAVVQNGGKYSCTPDEAFLLGMLHDIGYAFCGKQSKHAQEGGEMLRTQGYKYWREVFYHGIAQHDYASPELNLLNYVDMITGPNGEAMTIQKRIADISKRYGAESFQEKEAKELAQMLEPIGESAV